MKIEGLIAATFSTFHGDGSLDLEPIPAIVDKLIADGVSGVFICGTNGEGPNLTIEERMAVTEAYIKAVNKRILVLVHVGHSSIAEARKLAAHAAACGADAFSSVAAFYFKPTSVKNLAESIAQIAGAAPELPFYYYHIPHLTGVAMDMVEFLDCAGSMIPNLVGIKYTSSAIHEYQACLNYSSGKYDILFGLDELLLPALAVGAKGAIGSTYTFAAPLHLKTKEAFERGDLEEAREHHAYMVEVIRVLLRYPPIPGQKAIMKMLGCDLGPNRLPLATLDEKTYERFHEELAELAFFEKLAEYSQLSAVSNQL